MTTPTGIYPFVGITLAVITGIVIADLIPGSLNICLLLVTVTFLSWLLTRITFSILVFVAAVFYGLHSLPLINNAGKALAQQIGDREITVTGTAVVDSAANTILADSERSSFLVKSAHLELPDKEMAGPISLFVSWPTSDPQIGDVIRFEGVLTGMRPPRNPAEFDFAKWLSRQNIHCQIRVPIARNARIERLGWKALPRRLAQQARDQLNHIITKDLTDSPIQAGVISAMILGAKEEAPDATKELFLLTGTLHLFAVSGLHIGMLATIAFFGLTLLRVKRRYALLLTIPIVFGYALITGWSPSSVRAAIMTSAFVVATLLNRPSTSMNTLAVAAFLILATATQQLFSAGFQLSFFVVAALILLHAPIKEWFQQSVRPDPFIPRKLLTWGQKTRWMLGAKLSGALAITVASWLGSLFLTVWYFHLLSPVALVANLLVVPLSFAVLVLGVLSVLSFPFSTWLTVVFNNANWGLVSVIVGALNFFAALPLASFFVGEGWWQRFKSQKITVLDVAGGGAAILEVKGTNWLIDCGSETTYRRIIRPYLQKRGINTVDGLILTHGDGAHVGGLPQFLIDFPKANVYLPVAGVKSIVFKKLLPENQEATALTQGERIQIADQAEIEVLWPPNEVDSNRADDHCLVLGIRIENERFLFVSDSGFPTERQLLNSPWAGKLKAQTLIMGRHRQDPGGLPDFYRAIQPQQIIATAARFPRAENVPETLAKFSHSNGIPLFRMDETGAVEIEIKKKGTTFHRFLMKDELKGDF